MTIKETRTLAILGTALIAAFLAALITIKSEQAREDAGLSIVNEQVSEGLSKRDDLEFFREKLSHDTNAVRTIEAAQVKRIKSEQ